MSLSDLILFGTLMVNAGAVLNFKLGSKNKTPAPDSEEAALAAFTAGNDDSTLPTMNQEPEGVAKRLDAVLSSLRFARIVITAWNMLIIFAMFTIFSS